jgi:fatty-acid desaturase
MSLAGEPAEAGLARPTTTQPLRVYWPYAINIALIHLLALLVFVPWLFSWTGVISLVVGLYAFGTLGINLCYHRTLTHQSLVLPKWLERTFATLGVCCLQDSPARWVAIHRLHHQHSDEQPDPHSPLVGFLWGHFAWLLVKNDHHTITMNYERYCRDILRDPYYFWIERRLNWYWMYLGHALLYFLVPLAIMWPLTGSYMQALQFALSVLVWGVFVRTVVNWHITWAINSVTHMFGYQNYDTKDSSRNNVLLGILSNGEGWHNNHHAYQRCAAHGHKWWEFDVTYLTIRALAAVGLARNINIHPLDKKDEAADVA